MPFQSTLPAGEATVDVLHGVPIDPNFNPRFPRGKRPWGSRGDRPRKYFNPRFPRGKRHSQNLPCLISDISIHASRGGSDSDGTVWTKYDIEFQSTLPAGEATNIHKVHTVSAAISIHASRGGSDKQPVRDGT